MKRLLSSPCFSGDVLLNGALGILGVSVYHRNTGTLAIAALIPYPAPSTIAVLPWSAMVYSLLRTEID